jgi:TP901 family phage tail tape measure protein
VSDVEYRANLNITATDSTDPTIRAMVERLKSYGYSAEQANRVARGGFQLTTEEAKKLGQAVDETAHKHRDAGQKAVEHANYATEAYAKLGSQIKEAFSIVAVEEFTRRSYINFANMQEQMTRLRLSTGATTDELKHVQEQVEELAAATGVSAEKMIRAFRDFQTRSGLSPDEVRKIFEPMQQFADLTETSVNSATRLTTAAMKDLGVKLEEIPKLMGVWSTTLDGIGNEFATVAPRMMADMDRIGLHGVEAAGQLSAVFKETATALGSPMQAARGLQEILRDISDPRSKIGFLMQGDIEAMRAGHGDFLDLMDSLNNKRKDLLREFGNDRVGFEAAWRDMLPSESARRFVDIQSKVSQESRRYYQQAVHDANDLKDRHLALELEGGGALRKLSAAWDILQNSVGLLLERLGASEALTNLANELERIAKAIKAITEADYSKLPELLFGGHGTPEHPDLMGQAAGALNRAIGEAMKPTPQGTKPVPLNIPFMQEGGVVDQPTLAMVGEGGPEAVVPLGKARTAQERQETEAAQMWTRIHALAMGEQKRMPTDFGQMSDEELQKYIEAQGGRGTFGAPGPGGGMQAYAAGMGRAGPRGTGAGGQQTTGGGGPVGAPPVPFPEMAPAWAKTGGETGDWRAGGLESQAGAPGAAWPFPTGGRVGAGVAQRQGGRGGLDPTAFFQRATEMFRGGPLHGFIPRDAARWGITTGAPEEWARLFLATAQQESSLQPGAAGGGLFQMGPRDLANYGVRGAVTDPAAQMQAAYNQWAKYIPQFGAISEPGRGPGTYSGWGGAGAYFGSMRYGPGWHGRAPDIAKWMDWAGGVAGAAGGAPPSAGGPLTPSITPSQVTGAPSGTSPGAMSAPSGRDPLAFIMHHTAGRGTPGGVVADWQRSRPGVGTQYIMDREGNIHDVRSEFGYGGTSHISQAHTPREFQRQGITNPNILGMEIIAKDDRDLTDAQVDSAARFIAKNYPDIPIYGHGEVNPGHREATEGSRVVNRIREMRQSGEWAKLVEEQRGGGGGATQTARAPTQAWPEGGRVAGPGLGAARGISRVGGEGDTPAAAVRRRFPGAAAGSPQERIEGTFDHIHDQHQQLRSALEKPVKMSVEAEMPKVAPARHTFARARQWNQHKQASRREAHETLADTGPM